MTLYKTSDLALAAFLVASGFQLQRTEKVRHRGIFLFEDTSEIQQAVMAFINDEATVKANSFHKKVNDLKSLVSF